MLCCWETRNLKILLTIYPIFKDRRGKAQLGESLTEIGKQGLTFIQWEYHRRQESIKGSGITSRALEVKKSTRTAENGEITVVLRHLKTSFC